MSPYRPTEPPAKGISIRRGALRFVPRWRWARRASAWARGVRERRTSARVLSLAIAKKLERFNAGAAVAQIALQESLLVFWPVVGEWPSNWPFWLVRVAMSGAATLILVRRWCIAAAICEAIRRHSGPERPERLH